MRTGKDPDPYLWLMDPALGGSKTCGSPTLLEKLQNIIKFWSKKNSSFLYTFFNFRRNWCLSLRRGRPSSARSWTVAKASRSAIMPLARSVYHLFLFLRNARNVARHVSVSSVLIPKKCAKCCPSGHFVVFANFNKNAWMSPVRRVCRLCLFCKKCVNCRQSGQFVVFACF